MLFRWKHPAELGETYWQHAKYAFGVSYFLFRGSMQAVLHALIPDMKQNPKYDLAGIAEWTLVEAMKRNPPQK